MKLMHVSDTHGYFPELPGEFDAVVCSGDFFPYNESNSFGRRAIELEPNRTVAKRKAEQEFQKGWLFNRIDTFREWVEGKPVVWSSGNHDFFNPCRMLNDHGIEAIDLDNNVVEYKDYVWYGFPYVTMIRNCWNHERDNSDLKREVEIFVQRLKEHGKLDKLDILVAHCPPNNVLDSVGGVEGYGDRRNIGNKFMHSALFYQLQRQPKLYLCGHAHPSNGLEKMGEITVSNAAIGTSGKPRIIEV
jgi:Icc-related predicted phosphoesterase